MKIYDAKDKILGRMSTKIAKDLLRGETVIVINAEKAVLAGDPTFTFKHYLQRIQRGDPTRGPYFPKTPQGIVRRAIRGMLPYKKEKGKTAFKRLKVFVGIPDEYKDKEYIQVKEDVNKLRCKHITIGELSIKLGAKKRW